MSKVTGIFLKDARLTKLYKDLVYKAKQFPQYNFREHSLRRIDRMFGLDGSDPQKVDVESLLAKGEQEVASMGRMAAMANLYVSGREILLDDHSKTSTEPENSQ